MNTRCLGLTSVAVVLSLAALPAPAQDQLWIRQLGSNLDDRAEDSAPDGVGGVYLTGATSGDLGGPGAGELDAWLAHYDSTGTQIWIRQFGTDDYDLGYALAPDGAGGAFVSGSTLGNLGGPIAGAGDAWLARHDNAGNQLWIRQWGTSVGDDALAAEADGSGGVYVTGRTWGSLGGPQLGDSDVWLARFDSAGNQIWIRQFGTKKAESTTAATSDGVGGVYVSGWTFGNLGASNLGVTDAWLARFDSSGNKLWARQLGTSDGDLAYAVATDSTGGVYVSGSTGGSLGPGFAGYQDAWLARYSSTGVKLWIKQFGTRENDSAHAAAPDGAGGVFLTGWTTGSLGGPNAGNWDTWLARFDSAGSQIWTQQIGTSAVDWSTCATPDEAGGLYVGGSSSGSLGGPNAGGTDIWLARYDGSCNPGTIYCAASSTSIPGCQASISATGSPTLTNPTAWTVSSGPVPGANLGLLLFGSSGSDNTPYGTLGGTLCVASPTFHTAPEPSGGDQGQCNGGYAFTLADLIAAALVVTSGTTINAQVWARDPANPDGFLLSDGIEFTVCP
jgi:hypothetical protein